MHIFKNIYIIIHKKWLANDSFPELQGAPPGIAIWLGDNTNTALGVYSRLVMIKSNGLVINVQTK